MKLVNPVLIASVLSLIFIILGCGNGDRPVDSTADPFKASTGSKRGHDPDSSKQGPTRGISFDKYTAPGRFALQWGTEGGKDGQFNHPVDVAVASDGSVYVVEEDSHRIQQFTSEGVFVRKWGTEGRGNGQFSHPRGVAVGPDGYVYVTDAINQRVQKFTSDGVFVGKWGTEGSWWETCKDKPTESTFLTKWGWFYMGECNKIQTPNEAWDMAKHLGGGELLIPSRIAVGADGIVYVSDFCTYDCVHKFTDEGEFLNTVGTEAVGYGGLGEPYWWSAAQPYVGVSSVGLVYIGGAGPNFINSIQKFTPDGEFVSKWGNQGVGEGQFVSPLGVALSSDGSVYVADGGNNRIQKFTANGEFVTEWGTEGANPGEFKYPSGIAMGPDGYLYVVDTGNNRIQKFEFPAP